MLELRGFLSQYRRRVPRRSGVWVGADFCWQHEAYAHAPDRLPTVFSKRWPSCGFAGRPDNRNDGQPQARVNAAKTCSAVAGALSTTG
jgi:hypothetical protein